MLKKTVSIFFTVLFMATITAPAIIMAIDESIDISFLLDVSEEEEEKGKDKNKEFEVFVVHQSSNSHYFSTSEKEDNLGYTNKKYPKPHLNLISPPPKHLILH